MIDIAKKASGTVETSLILEWLDSDQILRLLEKFYGQFVQRQK